MINKNIRFVNKSFFSDLDIEFVNCKDEKTFLNAQQSKIIMTNIFVWS